MSVKVTKLMRTETAHRLDGHPGRCKFPHGHSYLWEVTLEKEQIGDDGMLVDFSDLKKAMVTVIDPFDHAFVLWAYGESAPAIDQDLALLLTQIGLSERVIKVDYRPTAENMAAVVAKDLKANFGPEFRVHVKLWETATSFAEASA